MKVKTFLFACALSVSSYGAYSQNNTAWPSPGSTNSVGIGTISPSAKLHIVGSGIGSDYFLLEGSVTDNLNYPSLSFKGGAIASNYPGVSLTNGGLALSMISGYNTSTYNYRSQIVLQGANGSIDFLTGTGSTSSRMMINKMGNVLIGKTSQTNNAYKLDIEGSVRANEVKVNTTGADFVFAEDYKLPSLGETEKFIKLNKHLPEIAPAKEMIKNGIDLGEMNIKLLQKVEELTLHLIEMNKMLLQQQSEIKDLKSKSHL